MVYFGFRKLGFFIIEPCLKPQPIYKYRLKHFLIAIIIVSFLPSLAYSSYLAARASNVSTAARSSAIKV